MGYWKLKPKININPYSALSVVKEEILDFVDIAFLKKGYEITDTDKENIFYEVRAGCYIGDINDQDYKTLQEIEDFLKWQK